MRVLVLNHIFGEFTGSEIYALQLCAALREAGHEADIGTFEPRGPLLERARDLGIRVHDVLNDEGPALDYDVLWAHHAPVLTHVIFRRTLVPCRVIFSSLSPLTAMACPPTYFEDLDRVLAHSPYNVDYLRKLGVLEERLHLFPNFAPKAFFAKQRAAPHGGLKRIAVVSNHRTEEVQAMAVCARQDGVQVDFIGGDHPVFVDETVLIDYDLVISIGKTVPYAFAQRVPVYCYDHFGGPGYLNADNFEAARYGNFCGRSFYRKLTAVELYADIKAGYASVTPATLDFLHEKARTLFSLEINLGRVCAELAVLQPTDLDALRRRHIVAGRLNDVYMGCLRNRIHFERLLKARGSKPRWRSRLARWGKCLGLKS
ncbi:glycosyltransferase [Rariglobus hedericola]|uniref:Glycosyltransferase family 4 protein n=1 Tax=Rariglobus hedericola TaxID=2597822 RepID=A0A556QK83_9BACT|nr:glycosyltransferase [Rariglobus hedericola]TSJ77022.1 glycosyltransferase family 4 protein [Rariglobus hedericola]